VLLQLAEGDVDGQVAHEQVVGLVSRITVPRRHCIPSWMISKYYQDSVGGLVAIMCLLLAVKSANDIPRVRLENSKNGIRIYGNRASIWFLFIFLPTYF
jgi:hypothetical protein